MVDPSYHKILSKSFGGAWTLQDTTQVPHTNALQSQNVMYTRGEGGVQVGTRLGFSLAFNTPDAMTAMYNWVSDIGNFLFWYRSSDGFLQYIDIVNQPAPQVSIPVSLTGFGTIAATFTPAGARLIVSLFQPNGMGATGTRVLTYQGGGFVMDRAFRPPLTYVPPAPVETAGGNVTAGLHYFGYLIVYRSGFITRPSPDTGVGFPSVNTFVPVIVVASGGTFLTWSLTTTWPVDAIAVIPIMTTATNPAQWLIPQGLSQAVVGGVSSTVTFVINIQDQLLTSTGQDVTANLTLITNSVTDTAQIRPSVSLVHGDRAVYVVTIANEVGGISSALLVSAIGAYQNLDYAISLIQLPGQRTITTCISLDGVLYIFGPQWTFQTVDNQGDPSSWATPKLVDGARGTLSIRGVQVSPSGTYAWVASQDGLYYFQGLFTPLPLSYYQDNVWNRINWNAAQAVQIKDIPHLHKVSVMACIDGATLPNIIMTWDYTLGFLPTQVNFSFDFLQSYNFGTMEAVDNGLPGMVPAASQQQELWLGPSSAGEGILRNNQPTDLNPYFDNGNPIFSIYETGLFPSAGTRASKGEIYDHHGCDLRMTGNGEIQPTAFTLDHAQQFDMALLPLSPKPGLMPHRGAVLVGEGVSYQFSQGMNLVHDPSFEGAS